MKTKIWNNKNTAELIAALLTLKNADQARRFLRDLMTEAELIEFGNRWKAARMLAKGTLYKDISKKTGLSSRTIARISRWLFNGMGGYKTVLSATTAYNHQQHSHPS